MMTMQTTHIKLKTIALFSSFAILTTASAQAQEKPDTAVDKNKSEEKAPTPPPGGAQMQELKKAHQRYQAIRRKLGEIRSETMKQNPVLVRQQEALQNLVEKKMQAQGYKSEGKIEELRTLQQKLQKNSDMSPEERQKMRKELRTKVRAMREARQKAMQSDQVKKVRDAFEDKLLAAMQKQNEKVNKLIEELEQTQKQMQALTRDVSARRQQQLQDAAQNKHKAEEKAPK